MEDVFICAVVVTYNPDVSLLERQLNVLRRQVAHIILVDNASSNEKSLPELIGKLWPGNNGGSVTYLKNEENKGLGSAQNQGIRKSMTLGASHVLIMDQDSIPDDDFISGLLDAGKKIAEDNIIIGALGPVYYSESTGEVYPISRYKGPFIKRIIPSAQPVEATFLISSGCLIPMRVFDEVGLMNEGLFIDYIDIEWSFRALGKGFKLFACPGARMKHSIGDNRTSVIGRGVSVHSPLRRYYLCRNSMYMLGSRHIPLGYKMREISLSTLRVIVFAFLSREKVKYFKYCMAGFYDGIRGKDGRCTYEF